MLWNASALKGYPIKGTDGSIGTVSDLMYQESDWVRIPTHRGQAFRFDRGHHSDLKPATIPT
jgi:hypothetical protein